jgi:hypothetical protein
MLISHWGRGERWGASGLAMPPVEATAMGSPNPGVRATARVEAVGPRSEHAHVRKVSHELCSASGDAPLLPPREPTRDG